MKGDTRWIALGAFALLALPICCTATAVAGGGATVTSKADVKWVAASVPGVSTAAVQGDMTKGPSHFFVKYEAGLATPVHYHTADHYVTTVSGTLLLTADGKEHRLAPGSYFAFTNKAVHSARCEGSEDCIMFIDARDRWDVVPAATEAAKH